MCNQAMCYIATKITNTGQFQKKLHNFVKSIPKDKLIIIISYFKIGRKATDKKANMIDNILTHFKKQLNPNLCQGGCGSELVVKFVTCPSCERKKEKPRKYQ